MAKEQDAAELGDQWPPGPQASEGHRAFLSMCEEGPRQFHSFKRQGRPTGIWVIGTYCSSYFTDEDVEKLRPRITESSELRGAGTSRWLRTTLAGARLAERAGPCKQGPRHAFRPRLCASERTLGLGSEEDTGRWH